MADVSNGRRLRLRSRTNLAFDVALLVGCFALAQRTEVTSLEVLLWGEPLVAGVWLVGSYLLRYYDPWTERQSLEDLSLLSLLVLTSGFAVGLVHLWGNWAPFWPNPSAFLVLLWPVALAAKHWLFGPLHSHVEQAADLLVIGSGPLARCTIEDLTRVRVRRGRVVGVLRFAQDPACDWVGSVPVLGVSDELERLLRERAIDEVYVAGKYDAHARAMQNAVSTCERLGIPFALPAHGLRVQRAHHLTPGATADGFLHYLPHSPQPHQRALKRLFDVVLSATSLLVLAPAFAAVALLIKLDSPGPVFFRQQRVGLRGRTFAMLKFRTMVQGAEKIRAELDQKNEQRGPVFKIKNDPRITAVGRFLRKHSIDELPQLLNVLRGEMSIVGPRPPLPSEVQKYAAWQRRRLSVRPGLTCIWQVSGRNQITFDEWMLLDMQYIDHWSFREDLRLVLRTVPVVLTGRGAS
ncbi:MAG TPA: sugar transferase [Myxococcaceae bacterium]|nr:sugar transferase [Myxococcaceae bacterium]